MYKKFTPEDKSKIVEVLRKMASGKPLSLSDWKVFDVFKAHFITVIARNYLTPHEQLNPEIEAESVFSDCLTHALIALNNYKDDNIRGWFDRICANQCSNRWRKEKGKQDISKEDSDLDFQRYMALNTENVNDQEELIQQQTNYISHILAKLSEKDQIILHFFNIRVNSDMFLGEENEKSAIKNIAAHFNWTEGTAKTRLKEAKQHFRAATGDDTSFDKIDFNKFSSLLALFILKTSYLCYLLSI
jgi:DNA-directed RNA polymerase specialized sigma24 family protein